MGHRLQVRPRRIRNGKIVDFDARGKAEANTQVAIDRDFAVKPFADVRRDRPAQRIPREEDDEQRERDENAGGDRGVSECGVPGACRTLVSAETSTRSTCTGSSPSS